MHRRQQRTFSDLYSGAVSKMHRRWQQRIAFLVIFKPEIVGSREKLFLVTFTQVFLPRCPQTGRKEPFPALRALPTLHSDEDGDPW